MKKMVDLSSNLDRLVHNAKVAAWGDSSDEEIAALQEALDEALLLLDRDDLREYDPEAEE
jgi:hypothetical protein